MLLNRTVLSFFAVCLIASGVVAEPEPPMENTSETVAATEQKPPSSKQRLEALAESGSAWAKARLEGKPETPQPVRRRSTSKSVARTKSASVVKQAAPVQKPAPVEPVAVVATATTEKPTTEKPLPAKTVTDEEPLPIPAAESKSEFDLVGTAAGFLLRLGIVIVLVYLTVAAIRMYWMRSGKPFRFSTRSLVVEESAPLSTGTAVHLVRLGDKRYLVGTAQGQVNILSEIAPDAPSPIVAEKQAVPVEPEVVAPALSRQQKEAFHAQLPPLVRKLMERPTKQPAMPSVGVARDINQSAQFIDEIRSRLSVSGKRSS